MDPNIQFVRISSLLDNTYVHAADDGHSVRLSACQASYNAVWRVEQRLWTDGQGPAAPHILFRGAYGRYLGALDTPSTSLPRLRVTAAQHDFDKPEVRTIMWRLILKEDDLICGIRLQCATGTFLENVSTCRSSLMTRLWKVDICPSLARPQPIIDAKPNWVKLLTSLRWRCSLEREINWVLADLDGNINEASWGHFQFTGRDLSSLEKKLRKLVVLPTTLCIRGGCHGQPTPFCINLPWSTKPLHIVLFLNDTTGSARLVYPDVNHGVREAEQ